MGYIWNRRGLTTIASPSRTILAPDHTRGPYINPTYRQSERSASYVRSIVKLNHGIEDAKR
jgi:hypothetical protein